MEENKREEMKLDTKYAVRLKEIDKRIEGLKEHSIMWRRAANSSPLAGMAAIPMADHALSEIEELKEERRRILAGTQQKIDAKKEELIKLKRELEMVSKFGLLKKMALKRNITSIEDEIEEIKKR